MSVFAINYDRILSIIGEVVRVALPPQTKDDPNGPRYGDLAVVREGDGEPRLAQVVKLDSGEASLQVFGGAQGLSTRARAQFLGLRRASPFPTTSSAASSPAPDGWWTAVPGWIRSRRWISAARPSIPRAASWPRA